MAPYFSSRWNTLLPLLLVGGPLYLLALAVGGAVITRAPAFTGINQPVKQPLPFSHEHHAGLLQIDCRHCHSSVESSAFAGMPSTQVCLGCHSQVWTGLAAIETLQSSQRTGVPVEWKRVHDLADFAYFDHSIHVTKGMGCVTCHGRVDRMPRVWKTEKLTMKWCLDCHRRPVEHLQPAFTVCDLDWEYPESPSELADLSRRLDLSSIPTSVVGLQTALAAKYGIRTKTSCSNCHQ